MDTIQIQTTFSEDIKTGLSSAYKFIPSKYFYNETGSRIFQDIMRMPEYYLTDCEYEIFRDYAGEISSLIDPGKTRFNLIELGAGDGLKTSLLIARLIREESHFRYLPVDISSDALSGLVEKLRLAFPGLPVSGIAGDYADVLKNLRFGDDCRKVSLFLGSNIGNFTPAGALGFLRQISSALSPGDLILTGFDLVKDPGVILRAYDDPYGYTRDFNLNLLSRMNEELEANFDLSRFLHHPLYDPAECSAKSYLVSICDQDVYFGALNQSFHFREWEGVLTEISRKFTPAQIHTLAGEAGFKTIRDFTDKKHWYLNALWEKI